MSGATNGRSSTANVEVDTLKRDNCGHERSSPRHRYLYTEFVVFPFSGQFPFRIVSSNIGRPIGKKSSVLGRYDSYVTDVVPSTEFVVGLRVFFFSFFQIPVRFFLYRIYARSSKENVSFLFLSPVNFKLSFGTVPLAGRTRSSTGRRRREIAVFLRGCKPSYTRARARSLLTTDRVRLRNV